MNIKDITVGIVTFRSEKVIFKCLKSLENIKKIIIIDNSNDLILKEKIRIINVIGDPIDDAGPLDNKGVTFPLHRDSPSFEEQSTTAETLVTGVKVATQVLKANRFGYWHLAFQLAG